MTSTDSTSSSSVYQVDPADVPLPKTKNELLKLLQMFPDDVDKRWDWEFLSANPNIPIEYIIDNPNLPWSWLNVCENPNLTMQTLTNFLLPRLESKETAEKLVDGQELEGSIDHQSGSYWVELSANPGIKIEEILNTASNADIDTDANTGGRLKFKWYWGSVVRRRDVTLEMLLQMSPVANTTASTHSTSEKLGTMSKPWNHYCASNNPNLTVEAVLAHPELWNFKEVVRNLVIVPSDEILYHPRSRDGIDSFPFSNLSSHPLLPFEWVQDNCLGRNICGKLYKWCWIDLSVNPGISVDKILANSQLPWRWEYVLSNPTITEEQVQLILSRRKCNNHDDNNGDSYEFEGAISVNPNLPTDFIIASCTNATPIAPSSAQLSGELEKERLEKLENFWSWRQLSENPNLTAQIVLDYSDKPWSWENISDNKFAFHESSLAMKEKLFHEQADPVVWHALLSVQYARTRLPKALVELTLFYFSPLY